MKDPATLMRAVASVQKYANIKNKKVCLDDFKEGLSPGFNSTMTASSLLGSSPIEKALVRQWLQLRENMMSEDSKQDVSTLQLINQGLSDRTFLAGENITVADFLIFHSIEGQIKDMTFQERESLVHLVRWFVHMQTLVSSNTNNISVLLCRTMIY